MSNNNTNTNSNNNNNSSSGAKNLLPLTVSAAKKL